MPTKEEIEDIKAECFANDVSYNYDVLKTWDEDKIRSFFESGGGGEGAAPSSVVSADGTDPFKIDMPKEVMWRMNADKTVAVITMNRPEARNAIDGNVDAGLKLAIARVKSTSSIRVVFLTGNGAMFCAGGDPKGFQEAAVSANNSESASAFAQMLADLNGLPAYTVGLANGSAMGGGFGLLCCCDCVIAKRSAFFALSEVKLGVIPATISPYVVAKIGPSNARRLFMTGETVSAEKSLGIGLVQEVVTTPEEMIKEAQKICDMVLLAAPGAAAAAKALVRNVQYKPIDKELQEYTAGELAKVRVTDECAGGMAAVQAGKKPPWALNKVTFPPA